MFATGVFAPCWVTSQRPPTFSVMSIRPSGRKAIFQGRFNVVTWVMVKGRFGSDFCSPALTCADAPLEVMARNSPTIAKCFNVFSFFDRAIRSQEDIQSVDACGHRPCLRVSCLGGSRD